MGFYFCGQYINIVADDKKVKWDMFMAVSHFLGFNDCYEQEWENHLEDFFSYFSLTFEQKYQYTQMRLVGDEWLKDSHIDCRCQLVIQNLFRTWYASHLLYASEADYSEPNVEKSEPKDVEDSKPESEVEEAEVKELPIEIFVDFSTEPTMRLLSLSPPMIVLLSLRLSDIYDPLQIFLQEAGSHEIKLVMVQSAVSSIFIMDNSHMFATCDIFDLSSFTFDLSWK